MSDFRTHPEYERGYAAAMRGEPWDFNKGGLWMTGWIERGEIEQYLSDQTPSENDGKPGRENPGAEPVRTVTPERSEISPGSGCGMNESPSVIRNVQAHTGHSDSHDGHRAAALDAANELVRQLREAYPYRTPDSIKRTCDQFIAHAINNE